MENLPLEKEKPDTDEKKPFVCDGHHETASEDPSERALKHIANALDPRGKQTSQLIDLLKELSSTESEVDAKLERIATAVERLAPKPPGQATEFDIEADTEKIVPPGTAAGKP